MRPGGWPWSTPKKSEVGGVVSLGAKQIFKISWFVFLGGDIFFLSGENWDDGASSVLLGRCGVGAQVFVFFWAVSLVLRLQAPRGGPGQGLRGQGVGRRGLSCSVPPASSPSAFPSSSCSRELEGLSGGPRSALDTRWLTGPVRL